MRIIIFFILFSFVFLQKKVKAQYFDTIHFALCDEMLKDKDNYIYQFNILTNEGDTLILPQISQNEFLNPLSFDKTKNEDSYLFLFKNIKYTYEFSINSRAFNMSSNKFCITKKKNKKGDFSYSYGYYITFSSYAKRNKNP